MSNHDLLFKAHPWHGISIGAKAPAVVTTFIEIVPTDFIKYEIDKESGHLRVDRPQKYSNLVPSLYGFVPQTYCGTGSGAYCGRTLGRAGIVGDGDPLDICVFSERPINHGGIILDSRPIGGFRLIDRNEADDKIIAVLEGDNALSHWKDIGDCPASLIDRLKHYFLTYKQMPDEEERKIEIASIYGVNEAYEVIRQAQADYAEAYGKKING